MNLKRILSLYAIISFLLPARLWGQQTNYDYGQEFLAEAKALDYSFKYKEALPLFKQAADCFAGVDSIRLMSYAYSCVGNTQIELGAFDLAKTQFTKALALAQKGDYKLEILIAKEGLLKLRLINGDGINTLESFRELFAEKQSLLGKDDLDLAITCNYIGSIYGNRGDFELAAKYFAKGLEIRVYKLGPDDEQLASSYYNLGNCLLLQGNFEAALQQMQKALYVIKKHQKEESLPLSSIYNGLGATYFELDQFEKAAEYLNKADEVIKNKLGPDNIYRQLGLINLAQLHQAKSQFDLAIQLLNERLALQKKHLPFPHIHTVITLQALGRYHIDAGMPEKGISILKQAERLVEKDQSGRTTDQIGSVYLDIGNFYLGTQAYEQAIDYYQKALFRFSWGDQVASDGLANPSLEKIIKWPFVLEVLHNKSMALVEIAKGNLEHPYHQLALETLFRASELIDLMRVRLKTASAQKSLSESGQSIYQAILKLAYQRYQADQSDEALDLAFWAAEKNKAFLLLRNTQKLTFNRQQILPDSLLNLEAELKADISYFETQLYQSREQEQSASFRELQNELFAKRIAYDSLTQYLEIQYPRYFQAQYPTERVSISEIQTRLQNTPQTTWLEYAWGDSLLFAFVIEANRRELLAIKTDNVLAQEISEFCGRLSGDVNFSENASQKLREFSQQSHRIFQQIVEPLQTYFAPSAKQLIIIPDRELFQLPFELLLTTEAENPSSYKDLPYLLHQMQVQYDASATIWNLQMQRSAQAHNKKSLIFAYDGNLDSGYNLETEDEADMIQSLIGGAIYKGAKASKDQFRRISSEYGLLHLGCHAQLDDVNPQFSALYLAQNDADDGKLSIQELSQSNLKAELAVLSACETGKGKYLDGEGLVSLTSGFLNAGVPAVVMSLWQVEDQSTQKLMGYFYQNLARGMDKDQALHEAKIAYLRLADPISAHPRFWAAFVAQGNMEPVSFLGSPSKFNDLLEHWYSWLIIMLILGVIAIYLGKRPQNAKFSGISK